MVVEHNEVAKSFTGEELSLLSFAFNGARVQTPDLYNFFVNNNFYKRGSGAGGFINELPFATQIEANVSRYFTPQALQKEIRGYPDCIDINELTGALQGFEFKNHTSKQALKELKFGNKYDILTPKQNFDFYISQYADMRIRSNDNLKISSQFFQEYGLGSKKMITRHSVYFNFNQVKNIHTQIPRSILK